jgi:alkylhydroperoxidase family enzyme
MKRGRLPWYDPGALTEEQRRLYDLIVKGPRARGPQAFRLTDDAGRLEGPFNALLVSPDVGTAVQELGSAIRYRSSLSARAREIAILELAVLRRSDFEWYAHERVGRQAGLNEDELEALLGGEDVPSFDREERLVRRLVRALACERDVDDETLDEAQSGLGEQRMMDLVALVGYYDLLALSLRVWRTPLPDGVASPFAPAG